MRRAALPDPRRLPRLLGFAPGHRRYCRRSPRPPDITGVVSVGQYPAITGPDLAEAFAAHFGKNLQSQARPGDRPPRREQPLSQIRPPGHQALTEVLLKHRAGRHRHTVDRSGVRSRHDPAQPGPPTHTLRQQRQPPPRLNHMRTPLAQRAGHRRQSARIVAPTACAYVRRRDRATAPSGGWCGSCRLPSRRRGVVARPCTRHTCGAADGRRPERSSPAPAAAGHDTDRRLRSTRHTACRRSTSM